MENDKYLNKLDIVITEFSKMTIPRDLHGKIKMSILALFIALKSEYLEIKITELENNQRKGDQL